MKISKIASVIVFTSLASLSQASPIVGKGIGYAERCKEAIHFAIQNAAENASNFIPVQISSYTEIRNSMLFRDEIASKQNYYLISYTADSLKGKFGCKVSVAAKFDSSKIAPIVTNLKGWTETVKGSGPIPKEIIESRKNTILNCYRFLAKYVQREYRSAFDVEITKEYSLRYDKQIEKSSFVISSNDQFQSFVKNTQILINELQDQFDFSPTVTFNFGRQNHGDYKSCGEFIISNSRLSQFGIKVNTDNENPTKYKCTKQTEREVVEPLIPTINMYFISLSSQWASAEHYARKGVIDIDSANSVNINDSIMEWLRKKAQIPYLPNISIARFGLDFDFDRENDSVLLHDSKNGKTYRSTYNDYYNFAPWGQTTEEDEGYFWNKLMSELQNMPIKKKKK